MVRTLQELLYQLFCRIIEAIIRMSEAQRVLARLLDGLDDRILTLSSQVFNYEHKYRWN